VYKRQVDASLRVTILANLLKLKRDFGISLLYITHDLATAYQISDHIIVLNKGIVVEQGDPEHVVKHPQHPYTQLLISSIPQADPTISWGDDFDDLLEGSEDSQLQPIGGLPVSGAGHHGKEAAGITSD
jgi:ABC-type dipeptide/oligopeptide/nickel transport system ATPase component